MEMVAEGGLCNSKSFRAEMLKCQKLSFFDDVFGKVFMKVLLDNVRCDVLE